MGTYGLVQDWVVGLAVPLCGEAALPGAGRGWLLLVHRHPKQCPRRYRLHPRLRRRRERLGFHQLRYELILRHRGPVDRKRGGCGRGGGDQLSTSVGSAELAVGGAANLVAGSSDVGTGGAVFITSGSSMDTALGAITTRSPDASTRGKGAGPSCSAPAPPAPATAAWR